MGTAIIVLILIVICVFSIQSYTKKLAHGCCGSGGDVEKKVKVRDKNPANYAKCIVIGVEGMTCDHCRQRVENALNAEDGVWAEADWKNNTVKVHMKQILSEDMLKKIISRAGYTMTGVLEHEK